jgi:hypothetical protein
MDFFQDQPDADFKLEDYFESIKLDFLEPMQSTSLVIYFLSVMKLWFSGIVSDNRMG